MLHLEDSLSVLAEAQLLAGQLGPAEESVQRGLRHATQHVPKINLLHVRAGIRIAENAAASQVEDIFDSAFELARAVQSPALEILLAASRARWIASRDGAAAALVGFPTRLLAGLGDQFPIVVSTRTLLEELSNPEP